MTSVFNGVGAAGDETTGTASGGFIAAPFPVSRPQRLQFFAKDALSMMLLLRNRGLVILLSHYRTLQIPLMLPNIQANQLILAPQIELAT